jgi:excisionase family DNA binding protein
VEANDLLTPQQLAEFLQVPLSWIVEKTRSRCPNRLPHFRIGRYLRFYKPDVEKWLITTRVS